MIPRRLLPLCLAAFVAARVAAAQAPQPTVITADAMDSQSTGDETVSVFDGRVHVVGTDITLDCDHLKIISSRVHQSAAAAIGQPSGLKYLLATGHVRISQVSGAREATCGQAEYLPGQDEIILRDHPVVVDHSSGVTESGEWIEVLRGKEEVRVHHPHVIAPPMKDLGFPAPKTGGPKAGAPANAGGAP